MCGRYTLFAGVDSLEERLGAAADHPLEARYNAAPGQSLPVVLDEAPTRITTAEWGLVPEWREGDSEGLVNARAETVKEKPSFAEAFERRRCLVPADGFYEWVDRGNTRQPYRVAFEDDRTFTMAGLWERWVPTTAQTGLTDFAQAEGPDTTAEPRTTFTIITTEPNEVVAELHHRQAVILDPSDEERWLHGDEETAASLLSPAAGDDMHAYPVSSAVNDPSNDDPDLVSPIDAE
ncbi:MAG: SOS response-associated peptidase [Halodesulfurarchaeum sp.]